MKWILLSALLAAPLCALIGCGSDEQPTFQMKRGAVNPTPKDQLRNANYVCEKFVRQRVERPSKAEFPRYHQNATALFGGGGYLVDGVVDIQHSRGAKSRTPYYCELGIDSVNWYLKDIHIGEQAEKSDGEVELGSEAGFSDYKIEIAPVEDLIMCDVTFTKMPPSPDVGADIVRKCVEDLVQEDGSRGVLGMAFNEAGSALPHELYGGPLSYDPDDGQIMNPYER